MTKQSTEIHTVESGLRTETSPTLKVGILCTRLKLLLGSLQEPGTPWPKDTYFLKSWRSWFKGDSHPSVFASLNKFV